MTRAPKRKPRVHPNTFLSDLWIGVSSDGIEDLATLHVDETDCQELIDGIYGFASTVFVPMRCTLTLTGKGRK